MVVSGLLISSVLVSEGVAAGTTNIVARKTVRYDLYNPRKRYKDEKMEIADAASRCNTAAFRKTHAQNVERAEQDGKPFGFNLETASTTETLTPLGEAYKKYLLSLQFGLEAMEEPYCGFGAFGIQAANKSYNKTVDRARSRFLEAVKQEKISAKAKALVVATDETK